MFIRTIDGSWSMPSLHSGLFVEADILAGFVKAVLKSVEADRILESVDEGLVDEWYRLPLSDVQVDAAIAFKEDLEKFVALL
jgi:hypothetical protein